MTEQEKHYKDSYTVKKGKRKACYCDLEGYDDVVCNYDQFLASTITDQVAITESSQHLDLVNKALCRKHYNKYIVNARKKKTKLTSVCSHPKHEIYLVKAQKADGKLFVKTPKRLTRFFSLPKEALMCYYCLYKTDTDPEYINLPDYLPPKERIPKENIKRFQGKSYVLRRDIFYSESEFQELESTYHEVCAEFNEAKLG
ncbi:hypothetical protein C2G38_2054758 [Gigaspora rosea]|uniref:Uncharacterized protein n=1 Tax=Gigaspora rosea TaxID=44941 RepID=A0A397W5U3_9GLOM|nr:hypothetical protein C2G38_2054758 [Gigaspora rosea]